MQLLAIIIVLVIIVIILSMKTPKEMFNVAFMGVNEPHSIVTASALEKSNLMEGMTLDQATRVVSHTVPYVEGMTLDQATRVVSHTVPYVEGYTNPHSQNQLPGGYQTGGTILTPDGMEISADFTFQQPTYGGIFSRDPSERAMQYQKLLKGPTLDKKITPLVS